MLLIKTIKNRLDNAGAFDVEVNAALAEGWQLKKRETIIPNAQGGGQYTHIMLYAELEKVVITGAERSCENCAHFHKNAHLEPCCSCDDGKLQGWEPVT